MSDSRPEGCVFKSRWGQRVIFGITEWGFHDGSDGKESACNVGRSRFDPWVGKIPQRRAWQPTPVFLPGEFHGQRSLMGYSPWGHKESAMTEQLTHKEAQKSFPPRDFSGGPVAKIPSMQCRGPRFDPSSEI